MRSRRSLAVAAPYARLMMQVSPSFLPCFDNCKAAEKTQRPTTLPTRRPCWLRVVHHLTIQLVSIIVHEIAGPGQTDRQGSPRHGPSPQHSSGWFTQQQKYTAAKAERSRWSSSHRHSPQHGSDPDPAVQGPTPSSMAAPTNKSNRGDGARAVLELGWVGEAAAPEGAGGCAAPVGVLGLVGAPELAE
jgi:hypothetical protein